MWQCRMNNWSCATPQEIKLQKMNPGLVEPLSLDAIGV